LRRSVLSFFILSNICQTKKLLSTKYATKLESIQFLAERRKSAIRTAREEVTDDINGKFDVGLLDLKGGFTFVASNLDNLPKFGPEEFNLTTVVDRQVQADAAIKEISVPLNILPQRKLDGWSLQRSTLRGRVSRWRSSLSSMCSRKWTHSVRL
jgi:hypothetical protein